MEKLAAAEQRFAETLSPIEGLRAWLLFADGIATKQIIAPALNALVGDPKKVYEASYTQVHDALRALVKRAAKNGDIRQDLDPIDLLRALVGVTNVASAPDWQQSAKRLVDILIIRLTANQFGRELTSGWPAIPNHPGWVRKLRGAFFACVD